MISTVGLVLGLVLGIEGHGFLIDPPQRSSLWRFYPNHFPPNYNDNALNCGGRTTSYRDFVKARQEKLAKLYMRQWKINGGRCGTCGDAYDDVRDHEDGGYFGTGFVARNYSEGSVIIVTVKITSNHEGWFEFRLCPRDGSDEPLETCLQRHVLKTHRGETKYRVGRKSGNIDIKLQLPPGIKCRRCVIQWKYNTGNSWDCDEEGCCIGCGPQEQFYNCADVGIHDTDDLSDSGEMTSHNAISVLPSFADKQIRQKHKLCTPTPVYSKVYGMADWCQDTCPFCPKSHCSCTYS